MFTPRAASRIRRDSVADGIIVAAAVTNISMIPMTINISISVKPRRERGLGTGDWGRD